jgi:16S rRNA (guanine1207-N2)-methyltransferase
MGILFNVLWKKNKLVSRLGKALKSGLNKPSGSVVVLYPDVDFDVVNLTNVIVVQPFFPTMLSWKNKGFSCEVLLPNRQYELAVVCCTRSREQTVDLIAQAAAQADCVVVDGQKVDGIESHYKMLKRLVKVEGNIIKGHGRLFWFLSEDLSHLRTEHKRFNQYTTVAGIFSAGSVDKGSELLAAALPDTLTGNVADFGSGWGFLSIQILKRKSIISLDLIEADANALEISKLNIKDARANFYWNDATSWIGSYDTVVINPPFHRGRSGNPDLGRAFIINSARNLRPKGELWMVANRHLPYEKVLNQCFENVSEILGNSRFKLFQASRPKRN